MARDSIFDDVGFRGPITAIRAVAARAPVGVGATTFLGGRVVRCAPRTDVGKDASAAQHQNRQGGRRVGLSVAAVTTAESRPLTFSACECKYRASAVGRRGSACSAT